MSRRELVERWSYRELIAAHDVIDFFEEAERQARQDAEAERERARLKGRR